MTIVGDIELFAWKNRSPVLAITGTNGKTTVTALTGLLLQRAGWTVAVAGNIGPACGPTYADEIAGLEEDSAEQGEPAEDEEDLAAAACATYVVLLAAHGRGLAGYWRTPAVLRTPEGRAAVGVDDAERVLGLIHLGRPRQEKQPPERAPTGDFVTYLS